MRLMFSAFLIVAAWPFALDLAHGQDHVVAELRDRVAVYVARTRIDAGSTQDNAVHIAGCRIDDTVRHGLPPTGETDRIIVVRGKILTA